MPEPAIRSATVRETSTSPRPAVLETRLPMTTAMPSMPSPRSSISPVCRPARTSSPSAPSASRIAQAHGLHVPARRRSRALRRRSETDDASVISVELGADHGVVVVENVSPAPVAQPASCSSGCDHVGEQHGCEHAIVFDVSICFGEELLDLGQHGTSVAQEHVEFRTREFDEAGVGHQARRGAARFDVPRTGCHVGATPAPVLARCPTRPRIRLLPPHSIWRAVASGLVAASGASPPPLQDGVVGNTWIVGPQPPRRGQPPGHLLALFRRIATQLRIRRPKIRNDQRTHPFRIRRREEHPGPPVEAQELARSHPTASNTAR